MYNPFHIFISRYLVKDKTPEITIDEYGEFGDPRIKQEIAENDRNKEDVRDESKSVRTKRRRQAVRRDS